MTDPETPLVSDLLSHGAEVYGFRGEVWTQTRIRKALAQEFGVWYSVGEVGSLLRRVGCVGQGRRRKPFPGNRFAIERWHAQVWPQIKTRAARDGRVVVFVDESCFYLRPARAKSHAFNGSRPGLSGRQTEEHLSVLGALTPPGKIYSLVRHQSLTGLDVIDFLSHLRRVAGERLEVIWDNSPLHRRENVKSFLAAGAGRSIQIEPLPLSAPELNPVHWLWTRCKEVELRHVVCLDLEELHMELHLALGRIRQKPQLVPSFFADAGFKL